MKENSEGAYVFKITPQQRLKRFLIIGVEGGSFYATQKELAVENLSFLVDLVVNQGAMVVDVLTEVSLEGLAKKQEPTLFTLALCMSKGDLDTKNRAAEVFNSVVRTGYHLFYLVDALNSLGGWGRYKRNTITNWYLNKDVKALAYQVTKYESRRVKKTKCTPWTHRDILRLCHAKTCNPELNVVLKYAVTKVIEPYPDGSIAIDYLKVVEEIGKPGIEISRAIKLIKEYKLPMEVIPNHLLTNVELCQVLLASSPIENTIRNLGRYTANKTLLGGSELTQKIVDKLLNMELLAKGKVHPFTILAALCIYESGQGDKGSLTWIPIPEIVKALDKAFYLCFKNVEPSNKRIRLCLDVSGSMGWQDVQGIKGLTPAKASAALALVIANVEPNYTICGFSANIVDIKIDPSMTLAQAMRVIAGVTMGSTNCSAPLTQAIKGNLEVDAFIMLTDSETNSYDSPHCAEELVKYRKTSRIGDSKLVVVGMVANSSSVGDPTDVNTLNVVGFSPDVPALVSTFISI
jgi:60 kDa SS-A/Ro ribonucleoprotein